MCFNQSYSHKCDSHISILSKARIMQDLDLSPRDTGNMSRLLYRKLRPMGKVRRRVQEVRNPSSVYDDLIPSRQTLDLSHNEATRLAADSLLSMGLQGYHKVLDTEGEVDFLSTPEKAYILENGKDGNTGDPEASDGADSESKSFSVDSQSTTQCPELSTDSDNTLTGLNQSSTKDVRMPKHVSTEYKVYFQSDSRAAGMKDLVRGFMRKAGLALAIVMDSFTDVELLCDLLEATRKRNVSIYLLLDHLNLDQFINMWQDLKLESKNFPKLSVRSVAGQTYCAKTGRKLTGQIAETFIIIDWTEVLTGNYSFSWLAGQVHRSLGILVKGGGVVPFRQEFQRLYSCSKPVCNFVNFISLPSAHPFFILVHSAQGDNTAVSKSEVSQIQTQCRRDLTECALNTKMPQSLELECCKGDTQFVHRADTDTQKQEKPLQLNPKPLVQPVQSPPELKTFGAVCTLQEGETNVQPLEKSPIQTIFPDAHVEPHPNSLTMTSAAERNTNAHGQQRPPWYQSTPNTMLYLKQDNVGTEGLFIQQRGRDRLTKPSGGLFAGLHAQKRQWKCSLNFKPNVGFVSEKSPSSSQTEQTNSTQLSPSSNPRELEKSGLQITSPANRRHDQPQRTHQHPILPHLKPHPPFSTGRQLKSQLLSDSKLLFKAAGAKLHPQPLSPQQVNPSPRLNWMPQNVPAGPRLVTRQSSLNASYVTGENTGAQGGWRPFHNSMNPRFRRSKSLNERHSAGLKGAGRNPNISDT